MTQTEKIGFGKNLIELAEKEPEILRKAGFDPDKILAILTAKYERAATANAKQEEMKRTSKAQTQETEDATDDLYRTASGYLDTFMAAAGKGSEAAKNFQRLRSRVRRPDEDEGVATPAEPLPEAEK